MSEGHYFERHMNVSPRDVPVVIISRKYPHRNIRWTSVVIDLHFIEYTSYSSKYATARSHYHACLFVWLHRWHTMSLWSWFWRACVRFRSRTKLPSKKWLCVVVWNVSSDSRHSLRKQSRDHGEFSFVLFNSRAYVRFLSRRLSGAHAWHFFWKEWVTRR